jgi:CDP-glucose 4,6-dehydratase
MEGVVSRGLLPDAAVWTGLRVLVTGHTGFKGGWLCHWLTLLGAEVHGLALPPPTVPSMCDVTRVARLLASDVRGDVGDPDTVRAAMVAAMPDVVIHMAAQPLVRESYADPLGTFRTNVMGTANVLEAVRSQATVRAVVVVTTDKVYRNREWLHPYREVDELGGGDPYSASKSGAELVTASYRYSYFGAGDSPVPAVVTARAGNVIGGGDWSPDRLVPDLLRAVDGDNPVRVRNPRASRPWQHVLDPLAGYLLLAERLLAHPPGDFPGAWNFGPDHTGAVPVLDLIDLLGDALGRPIPVVVDRDEVLPEAQLLGLDSSQSRSLLNWCPRLRLPEALQRTAEWHAAWRAEEDMGAMTRRQIASYASTSVRH